METGPRLKVSSDRLVKLGIEPATPGLQGKRFIHYTTAAPIWCLVMVKRLFLAVPWGCLRFVIVVLTDHTHLPFLHKVIVSDSNFVKSDEK